MPIVRRNIKFRGDLSMTTRPRSNMERPIILSAAIMDKAVIRLENCT